MGYKTNNLWPILCIGNLLILFASTFNIKSAYYNVRPNDFHSYRGVNVGENSVE